MLKVAILGAGMAGFGASNFLNGEGIRPTIYEKEPYYGGHTASFNQDGFIFDDGPHISFTKNKRIQELFAESVNHEYEIIQSRVNNYWQGHFIKHPVQCNLYGLDHDFVIRIIDDFVKAQYSSKEEILNYEDWLVATYGETFAKTFPMKYGLKFHTTTADNMTIDWIGPRLYKPDLKEVLHGALEPTTPDVHYVDHFRYPSKGGFVSYLDLFVKEAQLKLDHNLIKLDPKNRKLYFSNGKIISYDYVISSLPLPEIIPKILGAPTDVIEASQNLACTTCIIVTIGINRDNISEAHWSYFYDDDFFFTRLSFPHMQSPHNVPKGCGSIQAEVYYSQKYRPLDRQPEECI
ncbi:MAG: protoporphyrinogen/coproporphyrinogen oxidase, partial [Nitrospinales bacterium]